MKILVLTVVLLLLGLKSLAQGDSVSLIEKPGRFVNHMNRVTSTRLYRMTYIAVPLIVGGVIMQGRDREFRELRHCYAPSFRYMYDDYLQYAPAAVMVGIKAAGVKGRSSWGRMLVSDAFSAGVMAIAVNSLKYTVREMRPDGSGNNSFPSGHTATAFMTATMLHKEYGGRSAWYSIAGYSMATATGVSRMLNNKHWLSDVMVGAGIGILATEVGYLLADLIFKDRGITYYDREVIFDRYAKPSFFGLAMSMDIIPGTYNPLPQAQVRFRTGVSAVVEGAWFFSTYMGVGAQIAAGSYPLELNNVALVDRLKTASGALGIYGSYPITARWLVGGKVVGGYEYYGTVASEGFQFGERGGASFGAGASMTFHANEKLDVRFMTAYHLMPRLTPGSESLHRISLATSVNIAF